MKLEPTNLQVWFNYVPRGVGAGRDTMTVRLASGWNTLLHKVENRGGGFDVLGRFAPSPGEGSLDGMRSTVRRPPELVQGFLRPASTIIASQLFVADQLTWNWSTLEARGTAHLSAWGAVPLERIVARFEQGTTRWGGDTLARLEPGATAEVRFGPTCDELRRAALGQPPLSASFTWAGATRSSSLGVDPDRLLRRLWSRLALGSWIVDTTGGTQRLQTSVQERRPFGTLDPVVATEISRAPMTGDARRMANLLAFLMGVTPFVILPTGLDAANLPQEVVIQVGAGLLLLVALTGTLDRSGLPHDLGRFGIPACSLGWAVLSLSWAPNRHESSAVLVHWTCCAVLFPVAAVVAHAGFATRVLGAFCVAGVGTAAIGLFQSLGGLAAIPQAVPPAATFVNRNVAAEFVVARPAVSL